MDLAYDNYMSMAYLENTELNIYIALILVNLSKKKIKFPDFS